MSKAQPRGSQALWKATEKSKVKVPRKRRAWTNSWQSCKEFSSVSWMASPNQPTFPPTFFSRRWYRSLVKLFHLSPSWGTVRCVAHCPLDIHLLLYQMTSPRESGGLLQSHHDTIKILRSSEAPFIHGWKKVPLNVFPWGIYRFLQNLSNASPKRT